MSSVPDNETIKEITDLSLEFHFATEYTSLFVELPLDIQEKWYGEEGPSENIIIPEYGTLSTDRVAQYSSSSLAWASNHYPVKAASASEGTPLIDALIPDPPAEHAGSGSGIASEDSSPSSFDSSSPYLVVAALLIWLVITLVIVVAFLHIRRRQLRSETSKLGPESDDG